MITRNFREHLRANFEKQISMMVSDTTINDDLMNEYNAVKYSSSFKTFMPKRHDEETRIYGSLKTAYGVIFITSYSDSKGYYLNDKDESHFTNYRKAVQYAKQVLKTELEKELK